MGKRETAKASKIKALRTAAKRLGFMLVERDSLYVGPGISITIENGTKIVENLYAQEGSSIKWRCEFSKSSLSPLDPSALHRGIDGISIARG